MIEPYCVPLTRRTRRAVKLVLSREEAFFLAKPPSASAITIKTGVTTDGRMIARQAMLHFDPGFACHPRSVQIGSGSSTALVQITTEILGVRPERVALVSGDTDTTRMLQSLHCYGAQIVKVCSTQMAQTSRDERQGLSGNTT